MNNKAFNYYEETSHLLTFTNYYNSLYLNNLYLKTLWSLPKENMNYIDNFKKNPIFSNYHYCIICKKKINYEKFSNCFYDTTYFNEQFRKNIIIQNIITHNKHSNISNKKQIDNFWTAKIKNNDAIEELNNLENGDYSEKNKWKFQDNIYCLVLIKGNLWNIIRLISWVVKNNKIVLNFPCEKHFFEFAERNLSLNVYFKETTFGVELEKKIKWDYKKYEEFIKNSKVEK